MFHHAYRIFIQNRLHGVVHIICAETHRIPHIDVHRNRILIVTYQSVVNGKSSRFFILKSDAEFFSVHVESHMPVIKIYKLVYIFVGKIESSQKTHENRNRIQTFFGSRSVARNSVRKYFKRLAYPLCFQLISRLRHEIRKFFSYFFISTLCVTSDNRACLRSDHIDRLASGQFTQLQSRRITFCEFLCKFKHHYSLFAVNNGEISIRCYSEVGSFHLVKVVVHAFPFGFLIKSQYQAYLPVRLVSRVFQRFHRI